MYAPSHKLLEALSGLARRHVKACSSIKGLKGYLEQASTMASMPSRPVAQYSVELLDL